MITQGREHTRVLNLVRRAILETPDVKVGDLYQRACERYPWVSELSRRQFNARFVLKAKRERSSKHRPVRIPRSLVEDEPGMRRAPVESASPSPSGSSTRTGAEEEGGRSAPAKNGTSPPAVSANGQGAPSSPASAREEVKTPSPPSRASESGLAGTPEDTLVREALFDFAVRLVSAETTRDFVYAIGDVDAYVDRVMGQ